MEDERGGQGGCSGFPGVEDIGLRFQARLGGRRVGVTTFS